MPPKPNFIGLDPYCGGRVTQCDGNLGRNGACARCATCGLVSSLGWWVREVNLRLTSLPESRHGAGRHIQTPPPMKKDRTAGRKMVWAKCSQVKADGEACGQRTPTMVAGAAVKCTECKKVRSPPLLT